ncbi:hypothetical protein A2210_00045 [Candidatus Woesebacteria bacterium RIFOXYA1_FULL_40_18]|uniref:Carboxypeptidase regulatory-like domain-containing protein n=1 Tax=Candidatus Woesebacteria bacterium RIFOXYA1_FULL_40_18 TaxID=1802532 RepID=A0A1F8CLG1_9BACT|nr:MAG: hypothetical protein A2210_00045 [Candidatus Woesebacteria bacterium RIFOXYA1_FULL_40_18]
MTLKQFFQLAGGGLFSLLFYASPLHPLIKWPFVIFFALLGVALAFLPLEERPLEKWIIAFFRSVYSPTLFYWQKTEVAPIYFQEEAQVPEEKIISAGGEAGLKAYLASTQKSPFFEKLEEAEQGFLGKMNDLFGPGSAPSGEVKVASSPVSQPTAPSMKPLGGLNVSVEEKPTQPGAFAPEAKLSNVGQTMGSAGTLSGKGTHVQFSLGSAPPGPPSVANTVVGQILDTEGKIIEGAILEIRDAAGRPVRALKSNKLGHFLIVTPLQTGRYEIITEKDGFSFEPITFDALGEIIPPMQVTGKFIPKVVSVEAPEATVLPISK